MNNPIQESLKNGLPVVFIPHKGVDALTIHLRGCVGSSYEKPDEIGAAHLTEHLLLQKNQNKVHFYGGRIVGVTARDNVLFMVKVLKDDFERGLDFLSENLINETFNASDLEIQKRVATQEIKRHLEMPEKYIARVAYKNLFPGGRMATLNTGSIESVAKMELETVESFRKRQYVSQNFILVVCGNVEKGRVFEQGKKFFEKFPKGKRSEEIVHKTYPEFRVHLENRSHYKQTHLKIDYYGYGVGNGKRIAAECAANILEAYIKTKIQKVLGYAYRASCTSLSMGSYGIFSIYTATSHNNALEALGEIKNFVDNKHRLLNKKIIEQVKNKMLADRAFAFEKTSMRADFYSGVWLHDSSSPTYQEEIESIKGLSEKDVENVFEEILEQQPKITILSRRFEESAVKELWGAS
jgi:predicted Zn-dependent peptidase